MQVACGSRRKQDPEGPTRGVRYYCKGECLSGKGGAVPAWFRLIGSLPLVQSHTVLGMGLQVPEKLVSSMHAHTASTPGGLASTHANLDNSISDACGPNMMQGTRMVTRHQLEALALNTRCRKKGVFFSVDKSAATIHKTPPTPRLEA